MQSWRRGGGAHLKLLIGLNYMGAVGLGHTTGNDKMIDLITAENAETRFTLCVRAEIHYFSSSQCLAVMWDNAIRPSGFGSTERHSRVV